MGLFDWVKRKIKGKEERRKKDDVRKKSKAKTRGTAKKMDVEAERTVDTDMPTSIEGAPQEKEQEIVRLVAEYERLVERREKLQTERGQLTKKLDQGEVSPTEFRKQLMSKIQEASNVSDKIKRTSARLTQLGYRGVLH